MMKKSIAAALGLALVVTGCGAGSESAPAEKAGGSVQETAEGVTGEAAKETSGNAAKETADLKDFDVVLDWYPNAVHGFIYEAIEKGYYAEEGLNVNVRFPTNTNDALSLTAAGKADIGIYYMSDVIRARADQDVPVKAVGTVVQKPLNVFVSLKDKNITKPEDLIGKTIGQSGSELSEAMIKYLVENAGGSEDDVNVIDVGFDLMSAMTTGNVDATLGCMVNHEVPEMEDEGFEVNYFYPNDFGIPNSYELVFVAGDQKLKEERTEIEGFLRASAKGFEDMKNDPDEAVQILLNNQNEENFPLKESVEKKSIAVLLPSMETDKPFLTQDKTVWDENIKWLRDEGVVKNEITADELVDDVYVR